MAQRAASKQKGVNSYVQIGLYMANEDRGPNEKKFSDSDLDNPTAELVQKIFISALTRIYGTFLQVTHQELPNFNCGGNRVVYNVSVDNIYKHLIKCFPEDTNMIDYSLLLSPSTDTKRTYQAISYIVAYVLFCDLISPDFDTVSNELNAENQQKFDLCSQIEDIGEKIAELTTKHDNDKKEVPMIEIAIQGLKDVTKSVEEEHSNLLSEMQKDKIKYDEMVQLNKNCEEKISNLQKACETLEHQVVKSPEELVKTFEERKQVLENAKALRIQLSSKLEQVGNDEDMMNKVVDMGSHCVSIFYELVNKYNETGELVRAMSDCAKVVHNLDQEISVLNKTVSDLNVAVHKISQDIDEQRISFKKNMSKITHDIEQRKRVIDDINYQKQDILEQINSLKHGINTVAYKLEELMLNNEKHQYYCAVIIEHIRQYNRGIVIQSIGDFNDILLG